MSPMTFNLAEFLPYKMSVLSARISKMLSHVYGARYGLSRPEWRVLVHVACREKMSVREIHEHVYLDKPSVSRAVAKLQHAGLLAKSTCDSDQRLVEIEITASGFELFHSIVPQALAFEAAILDGLTDEERDQLNGLMERLHDILDTQPNATRRPLIGPDMPPTKVPAIRQADWDQHE